MTAREEIEAAWRRAARAQEAEAVRRQRPRRPLTDSRRRCRAPHCGAPRRKQWGEFCSRECWSLWTLACEVVRAMRADPGLRSTVRAVVRRAA